MPIEELDPCYLFQNFYVYGTPPPLPYLHKNNLNQIDPIMKKPVQTVNYPSSPYWWHFHWSWSRSTVETTSSRTSTTKTKILQTESFSSFNTIIVNNNNPTTWTRHCSCLQHPSKSYKKLVYSPNSPGQPLTSTISSYNYRFMYDPSQSSM